jgi:hypothetical protein
MKRAGAAKSRVGRTTLTGRLGYGRFMQTLLLGGVIAWLSCGTPQALANPKIQLRPEQGRSAPAAKLSYSRTRSNGSPYAVCSQATKTQAQCLSISVPTATDKAQAAAEAVFGLAPEPAASPRYEGSGEEGGFSPADLRSAYGIPTTGGSTQTVAIVDARDDPKAEADLKEYRAHYGLSECTSANGCFKKINQKGEEGNYPTASENWSVEISLDLDMVSAICQECHILLVEANTAELSEMDAAENEAAKWEEAGTKRKATEISNSWGSEEHPTESSEDSYFDHPGVPTTVASGDDGYKVSYPASSPYVIAVGGTELKKASTSRGWEETVWSESGSGCSSYESKPAWQSGILCGGGNTKRIDNDVAAVAALASPVSVYDSDGFFHEHEHEPPWVLIGGTSVGAPLIAGIEAHVSSTVKSEGAEAFYKQSLFDVTSGSNGHCAGSYLCTAEEGYDGPTGWGSPDGLLELAPGYQVFTAQAKAVTASSATLSGFINPGGKETSYRFEYGKTTSYTNSTPIPNATVGSGGAWLAVNQTVHVSEAETTYHYRLVATNSAGTLYGKDHTFTTFARWTVLPAGDPVSEASPGAGLGVVSCVTPSECLAVAADYIENGSADQKASAQQWNGKEWKLLSQPIPEPTGSTSYELSSVSCFPSACMAVGTYVREGKIRPLAERWNGKEWTLETVPMPIPAEPGAELGFKVELAGVSCSSAAVCTAVGNYWTESSKVFSLAERWEGGKWSVQTTPNSAGKHTELATISCTAASKCTAVGKWLGVGVGESVENYHALIEQWNGSEWSQLSPNTGLANSELSAVSCPSASMCMAVSGGWTAESDRLVERWNGTEWLKESITMPVGSYFYLSDVSCPQTTSCTAVGRYQSNSHEWGGFAVRWNGSSWSAQQVADIENAVGPSWPFFGSVACWSATTCMAGGTYINSTSGLGSDAPLALIMASPIVETSAVSAVSASKATLRGKVNPESLETKYHFEYGVNTTYGSSTTEEGAGEGMSSLAVSSSISGLTAGTAYHYRLVASNSAGVSYGPDMSFTAGTPTLQPVKGAAAFPLALTAGGGGLVLHVSGNQNEEVACAKMAGSGSFTSVKEGKLTLKLLECTGKASGIEAKCTSKGGTTGEIATAELKALLAYGYPSKATTEGRETGMVLSPASGEVIAEFTCAGLFKIAVKGSMIGVAGPLDSRVKTFNVAFKQASLVQSPSEYELESGTKVNTALSCIEEGVTRNCAVETVTPDTITLSGEEAAIEGPDILPTLQPAKAGGFPVALTAGGGGLVLHSSSAHEVEEVSCRKVSGSGAFTNVKEGKMTLKLLECTGRASGIEAKCTTKGGATGEITTAELKALLAYAYPSKATAEGRETGLVLSPVSGEVITEFTCAGLFKLSVKGAIVGVVSPLGSLVKTFNVAFKQASFVQQPSEYELESGGKASASPSCLEETISQTCGVESIAPATITLSGEEGTIEA